MVLKLNIFTLVALGLLASSRSQTVPACDCTGNVPTECATADACACVSGQPCDVIVKVAAAGPATHLGCSGQECVCDIDTEATAPTCTGATIVTNGATELEYKVTSTDGSAECEFALAVEDISGVKCTTTVVTDVVQMGNLFTCTGVAIQTDGTGCVFTADTSIACAAGSACTVASVEHSGLNCVGEGCSISVDSSVETVNSASEDAVVSFSTDVGCTNPSGGGDCTCDSDSESCTSSTVGAVVTGGASATCEVEAIDRPTCTCNALGCDEPEPDVKTCTCESLGVSLATDCNGDASSCACHTGGNCKITVNYQTTPTGLTCSGENCECTFNGEKATCEGGPTITSGVTAAELTVTNVGTASCSINISDMGNVDTPACEGGASDTIGNDHFTCTGVIFDTLTPTGCKMLPQEIGQCVGDDGCSITSLDETDAKCVGAMCSGSITVGIVTMTSLGGDAVVQSSTVVTCTNPSGAGDCKCVLDTTVTTVQSCTSTTDGGTVTGGASSECNNADCTSCDVGSVPTCTCDATSCEGCFCDGPPTDAPTDGPSDGPSVGPSDEMTTGDDEMTTDDEETTTTKGLPSGAVMVSHVYGGWVVGSLVAVAVAKA